MGALTWTAKKAARGTGSVIKKVAFGKPKPISKIGTSKGAGKGAAKGAVVGGPVGAAGGAVYGGVRESGNAPLAAKRVIVDAPIKAGGLVWTGSKWVRRGASLAHRKMYD
jgi:hypothetical protein